MPGFFNAGGNGDIQERKTAVDSNVSVKLCVAEGELKINGWARDEVRVFVKNGREFHMKALEKSAESGKVNWLWVGNVAEGRPGPGSDCLAGQTIEIDRTDRIEFRPVGARRKDFSRFDQESKGKDPPRRDQPEKYFGRYQRVHFAGRCDGRELGRSDRAGEYDRKHHRRSR
jgi:hypothetical protein